MARYLEADCRLCRREQMKLFLKGTKCNTEKCTFSKRPTPPGMQKRLSRKQSNYALQLREKQKTKRIYGMLEAQFKRFFRVASQTKGVTGRTLLQMLERRLDNVIYRALFAFSRDQARQFVRHGFVFINSKRVDIPSYLVKITDALEIRAHDKFKKMINGIIDVDSKTRSVPSWFQVDNDKLTIKIIHLPEKEEVMLPVNEQLIVELYSK